MKVNHAARSITGASGVRYIKDDIFIHAIKLLESVEGGADVEEVCPFCNVAGNSSHKKGCLVLRIRSFVHYSKEVLR